MVRGALRATGVVAWQLRLHGLAAAAAVAAAAAARPTHTTSTAGALRATSTSASTLGSTIACPAADAARTVLGTSIACTGCGTTAAAATAAGVGLRPRSPPPRDLQPPALAAA